MTDSKRRSIPRIVFLSLIGLILAARINPYFTLLLLKTGIEYDSKLLFDLAVDELSVTRGLTDEIVKEKKLKKMILASSVASEQDEAEARDLFENTIVSPLLGRASMPLPPIVNPDDIQGINFTRYNLIAILYGTNGQPSTRYVLNKVSISGTEAEATMVHETGSKPFRLELKLNPDLSWRVTRIKYDFS